jgi:hypothetical protein
MSETGGAPMAGKTVLVTGGTAGIGRARRTMRWKPALNAIAITFADASREPRPTDGSRRKTPFVR